MFILRLANMKFFANEDVVSFAPNLYIVLSFVICIQTVYLLKTKTAKQQTPKNCRTKRITLNNIERVVDLFSLFHISFVIYRVSLYQQCVHRHGHSHFINSRVHYISSFFSSYFISISFIASKYTNNNI